MDCFAAPQVPSLGCILFGLRRQRRADEISGASSAAVGSRLARVGDKQSAATRALGWVLRAVLGSRLAVGQNLFVFGVVDNPELSDPTSKIVPMTCLSA